MKTARMHRALALGLAVSAMGVADACAQDAPVIPEAVDAAQLAQAQTLAREAVEAAGLASADAARARAFAAQAARDSELAASRLASTVQRAERAADAAELAARGAILSPTLGETCTAGETSWRRLRNGGSGDRRCVLTFLRAQRQQRLMLTADMREANWSELLQGASILGDYYLARSNRQQAVMDGGASTTALGALGAGLSGPAGTHTVTMWGYGALLGVVLVNFTGSQPSRDLHFAGFLGVEHIVNRYVVLNNRLLVLDELIADPDRKDPATVCGGVALQDSVADLLTEVEGWPPGDDKSAFLPVLQQMNETCTTLKAGEVQFARIKRLAAHLRREWPAAFASDLLSLDNRIAERDAGLRLTPTSAVSAAAVAPLRVLDSLISGENTQDAVNRVRINALLDNMTVELRPLAIPPGPVLIERPLPSLADINARSHRTDRSNTPAPANPSNERARSVAAAIRAYAVDIEAARVEHNDRAFFASELHAAAARSLLTFDYAVGTGVASISLAEPGAPAARSEPSEDKPDSGPEIMPLA